LKPDIHSRETNHCRHRVPGLDDRQGIETRSGGRCQSSPRDWSRD